MDSEKQHRVLLRHYKRLGMVPVRDITEDIACVPGTRHLVYPCSLRMALPPPAMQHVVQLTIVLCRVLPDRMIWGGIGTLMEAEIEPLLLRNAAELRRMRKPSQTSS
jgi:hypothetical protein